MVNLIKIKQFDLHPVDGFLQVTKRQWFTVYFKSFLGAVTKKLCGMKKHVTTDNK